MTVAPASRSSAQPPSFLKQNYHELELIVEDLKAEEKRAKDPADLAEVRKELATWEQLFKAAGGDPSRVRPASTANDLRIALSGAFPILKPDRYLNQENNISRIQQYRAAASDMPGPDQEVLARREDALKASLEVHQTGDRLQALGMGLAQLSWMAAVPAYLVAGGAGLLGCVGALAGGVGLMLYAGGAPARAQQKFMEMTPSQDVPTLVKWMEKGEQLVEEHVKRQAELFNNRWMQKALAPDPSGIQVSDGHILVGGVRLKTRQPSASPPPTA